MKLRTLIVDLDCPFGINHFNLVECDQCLFTVVETDNVFDVKWNMAPYQQTPSTGTWTITAPATTTDVTWTNVGGTGMTTTSFHAYSNASDIVVHNAVPDNMHLSISGTTTTDLTKLFEEEN